ncbi:MAG TPA: substrate-binding domain-containing protein [Acetobacteraceae bacterium]|nr:substrate-binding domain-containing protein [Acetobacteraceae bacterium]
MSHGTMKKTLLTACAAAALAVGAGHGASAAVNTVCAEPNPAGAALSYPTQPPLCLLGGGSSLAAVVYQAQAEAHFGVTDPSFGINYSSIGSGSGQNLFLDNSSTFDANNVTPSGQTIAFGASDATLSAGQISTWATSATGQSVSGNLIQIPTFGTAIAVVFKKTSAQQEGELRFNDTQLCGIFSGKITSWQDPALAGVAISPSTLPIGTIHPIYRIDGSGTSFLLTQHLHQVCTTGAGGDSNITFTASANFAGEFGGTPPSNFIGATNSSGIQTTVQTAGNTANEELGYLSPDYTLIAPANSGRGGYPAVAEVQNSNDGIYYLPTSANTQNALANVPAPAAGDANPADYVPPEASPPHFYPIVGFTTVDLAQCYSNATVGNDVVEYWQDFYTPLPYMANLLVQHGFTPLPANLSNAVFNNLLTAGATGNTDVMEPNVCASAGGTGAVAGR